MPKDVYWIDLAVLSCIIDRHSSNLSTNLTKMYKSGAFDWMESVPDVYHPDNDYRSASESIVRLIEAGLIQKRELKLQNHENIPSSFGKTLRRSLNSDWRTWPSKLVVDEEQNILESTFVPNLP